MKRILITFFLVGAITSAFAQSDCGLPINEDRILENRNLDFFISKLKTDSFRTYFDKKKIPYRIGRKLRCLIGRVANPNEERQSGCIVENKLSARQLNFFAVAVTGDMFIITYRTGAAGVSMITMMFSLKAGSGKKRAKRIDDVWIGQTGGFEGRSIPELLTYILKHKDEEDGLNTNALYY